ncbi:glycosyl hydrolase [Sphingobacterium psychroaquaticum]|uniref:glycoside hydrolase family 127 protein n=1 Tax=Sphingobacterium psychroaquaticum TaxID=561061 RepID=UPI00106C2D99|nr:glycoside hydrolase family 127 protein [Sphingobacterium psychroaquaticum]QBQ40802.1 glycosyl hydrolase [Sphingobacterium psychroaquaticum]
MKHLLLLVLIAIKLCVGMESFAQPSPSNKIQLFPLHEVRLLDGPFKHAQETDKRYLLRLNPDRLLAPFLREAGLLAKTDSYTNWENTGLDGHIGGHYLTALSLMYASTGDPEILEKLVYMLSELRRCQEALGTGYIGAVPGSTTLWSAIQSGNIAAGTFDLNKKWVPLYNIHKTYAGLRDAYLIAGQSEAKEMLVKMTDWAIRLVQNLSEYQIQDMLRSEHGGLNEVFADVAAITGDTKYLTLAKQFSHHSILQPLVEGKDALTGLHANTQIPKVIGFKRIADMDNNKSWDTAARFFWETVVQHRTVAIGGNSAYEHFHPQDDFSNMINSVEGPETCNTYNMLKLSVQLFQTEGDVRYVDFYERALYNHILSTQHPTQGGFVYFTPMRPGHYRVYSQPQTSFWCCVGSGLENHAKYGEFIYAHDEKDLWVNLFISSTLDWKERGVQLRQETSFPQEPSTKLTIETTKAQKFGLKLRYPAWVRSGDLRVTVNGVDMKTDVIPGQYVRVDRIWKSGDQVELHFKMHVDIEQMPDHSSYFAYLYGPIVLAAKTDTAAMAGILADDSRGGHIAKGPQIAAQDIPVLVGPAAELKEFPSLISPRGLRFRLAHTFVGDQEVPQELIPFYQLHDSRYIIYWPQVDNREALRQKDSDLQQSGWAKAVVDKVECGQQQPESDHDIDYEQSETGVTDGRQWREASGWFSYTMKNVKKEGRFLMVHFFKTDEKRNTEVRINGTLVSPIRSGTLEANELFAVYALPAQSHNTALVTVRFQATENNKTNRMAAVMLLTQDEVK